MELYYFVGLLWQSLEVSYQPDSSLPRWSPGLFHWNPRKKIKIKCKTSTSPVCSQRKYTIFSQIINGWMLTMYFFYLGHVTDNNCHDDSIDSHSFTEDNAEKRSNRIHVIKSCFWVLLHNCLKYTQTRAHAILKMRKHHTCKQQYSTPRR